MRIAILGSGLMGSALGTLWARAGHEVAFTYSRDRAKLKALARDAGPSARVAEPAAAVSQCDAVLVAIPWHRLADALGSAGAPETFAGRAVITCSLPMTPDDADLALGHSTSGAEMLASVLPGARVVAAFNTIPSELLRAELLQDADERPAVIYCGDDDSAKGMAAALVRDAMLEPVDAGPLRIARWLEPFGVLIGQLAYTQELGPELGYRLLRLGAGGP